MGRDGCPTRAKRTPMGPNRCPFRGYLGGQNSGICTLVPGGGIVIGCERHTKMLHGVGQERSGGVFGANPRDT